MNKEITIIELLNKIANNKQVPEKIKFMCENYKYYKSDKTYYNEKEEGLFKKYNFHILNAKVEIIDEENVEFEDIEEISEFKANNVEFDMNYIRYIINQLIKNQKKIIERLNKDE